MQPGLLHTARRLYTKPELNRFYSSSIPKLFPRYVFDIDGVLIRGEEAIPHGRSALHRLYCHRSAKWRVPVAFLTNGGGVTERTRALHLTEMLGVPIDESQMVLAHTPMRMHAPEYNAMQNSTILTVGNDRCVDVAVSYGFQRVLSTAQLGAALPQYVTPFATQRLKTVSEKVRALAKMHLAAVFVMADPRDWGRDIQLLCDILASNGDWKRTPLREGQEQCVDLFFCNEDVLFPNEYHLPRIAAGCFKRALQAVFELVYPGRELRFTQFGKPHPPNYAVVEKVLHLQAARIGLRKVGNLQLEDSPIYAVGDNPSSDVRGANNRGYPWVSVLVKTGNFQGTNCSRDTAQMVMDHAFQLVERTLHTPKAL